MTVPAWRPRRLSGQVPIIRRVGLLRRLAPLVDDAGPRLALLSAPAGFGKTTLLSQFSDEVATGDVTVAWADLETAGNSTRSMWRAVLSALDAASPAGSEAVKSLLSRQRRTDDAFFERVRSAFAELPNPTLLVLDDLQVVDDSEALRQLGLLARKLPEPLRLVLSSRHDPRFPIHRLSLAGELVELRADALAFSASETEALLQSEGFEAGDVDAVVKLTEGWPAGVQLARGLMKEPGDGARLAGLFNAQTDLLADHLFQETFTSQSPSAQDLLMRTSVVSTFDDGLAAELAERDDAGEAMVQMADLAPLLSRYGADGTDEVLYRYHPLLRSYLASELARRDQPLLRATHHTAALWFERHDQHLEAIEHASASEDAELLDSFLRQYAPMLLNAGESEHLLRILNRSHLAPTAWGVVIGAVAAFRRRRPTEAARWLSHPGTTGADDPRLARLRTVVACKLDSLAETGNGADPAEILDGEDAHAEDDLELLLAVERGTALIGVTGDGSVEGDLEHALDLAVRLGRRSAEHLARILWAAAALGRADFTETERRLAAARQGHDDLGEPDRPPLGLMDVLSAWVSYEQLDEAAAADRLDAWIAEADDPVDPCLEAAAHRLADLLRSVMGTGHRERSVGERPAWPADLVRLPRSLRAIACFTALRSQLDVSRPDQARQILDDATFALGRSGDVVTMQAMVLTAQHREDVAAKLLQPVLDGTSACRSALSLAEALVLATCHALRAGHTFEAFSHLERSLTVARETGSYRALAQAPPEVHAFLVDQSQRLSAYQDVVDRLVAHRQDSDDRPRELSPLTRREIEVLHELPTLNRVDEIANDLLISTNTVKTHIRGIYRKLGVGSRKEAVQVARRRGII